MIQAALLRLWARVSGYAIAAAGLLAVVGYIFARGRSEGRQVEINRQREATDETRRQHDAIEGARPDFDAAIGRLRRRSEAGGGDPH